MRINWLGVLIAAIVITLIRYLWNAHFGGADWGHFVGKAIGDIRASLPIAGKELVRSLVISAVLGWVIGLMRDRALMTGILAGVVTCIGFAITTIADGFIHGEPLKTLMVDGGFLLVAYLVAGAILGAMAPTKLSV
jgi:hypothetical protein